MGDEHPTLSNGKICYIEMPARDVEESAAFYTKVFVWRIRQGSPDVVSIMVDDIAATVKAIVTHGGKIVQPIGMDTPEVTARFSDPAGNVIGLYQESRRLR